MVPPTDHPHTVHSYDEDLGRIRASVRTAGELAQQQVRDAVDAMQGRDLERASQIVAADGAIDLLQTQAEQDAILTISRRAPMADDLREIIAAIKIAGELERVGDYAKNIAKRVPIIAETPAVDAAVLMPDIADYVAGMISDAVDAYIERDTATALSVIERDATVDKLYNSLFRSLLLHMIENPKQTTQGVHLLFVAKNLERVGDRATNIAEMAHYLATGTPIEPRVSAPDSIYTPSPEPGDN